MLCVQDCVSGVWREVNGIPEIVEPELCNRCGHCVAVCPDKAIVHDAMDTRQIRSTDRSLMKPDFYREIVRCRRSIRNYKDEQVPHDTVQHILELASHSPTASNRQDVAYTVITDKGTLDDISRTVFGLGKKLYERSGSGLGKFIHGLLRRLSVTTELDRYLDTMAYYIDEVGKGRDYILHHAPVLILIHGPRKGQFHNENCNIAAANIMNYACTYGLGTCYIGFLLVALKFSGLLRKRIQVPKDRRAYACLVMGYPSYRHRSTSSRKLPSVHWVR